MQEFRSELAYRQRAQSPRQPADALVPDAFRSGPRLDEPAGPPGLSPTAPAGLRQLSGARPLFGSVTLASYLAEPASPDGESRPQKVASGIGTATTTGTDDVETRLGSAIRAMESRVADVPKSQAEVAEHAKLRMLYLLGGRADDAMRPIPTMPPALQEFWKNELSGLSAWLDTTGTSDSAERMAEAQRRLERAMDRLAEAAPLEVRNLAFCTDIQSFGCFKRFENYEFEPGQEVLLYVEVENFTRESTPQGYHTALRSSYQIFDARKQSVGSRDCPRTEEFCRNPRRDFFISYRLMLPQQMDPGKHTLQLTIEDLKSQKIGQASIELVVKEGVKR
jgi:hypothetical protein